MPCISHFNISEQLDWTFCRIKAGKLCWCSPLSSLAHLLLAPHFLLSQQHLVLHFFSCCVFLHWFFILMFMRMTLITDFKRVRNLSQLFDEFYMSDFSIFIRWFFSCSIRLSNDHQVVAETGNRTNSINYQQMELILFFQ